MFGKNKKKEQNTKKNTKKFAKTKKIKKLNKLKQSKNCSPPLLAQLHQTLSFITCKSLSKEIHTIISLQEK